MKIRYEITIDDYVAFNRFHCRHSPTIRRNQLGMMVFLATLPLAGAAALAIFQEDMSIVAGAVAGAITVILMLPRAFRQGIERQSRRLFKEGANKVMDGPHELELIGTDLVERCAFGESKVRLEIVERVVSDGDYTFIYMSALTAHVIPHDRVSEGDPLMFANAIRQRIGPSAQDELGDSDPGVRY